MSFRSVFLIFVSAPALVLLLCALTDSIVGLLVAAPVGILFGWLAAELDCRDQSY